MPHKRLNGNVAAPAVEAVRSKRETIRSASARVCIHKISLARSVSGQVEMSRTAGPPTVLSVMGEAAFEVFLVYASSHCLGLTRIQLSEGVRKLCIDGRLVPGTRRRGQEMPGSPPSLRGIQGFRQAAVASMRPTAYIWTTHLARKRSTIRRSRIPVTSRTPTC